MPSSIIDKLRGILRRPQNTTADLALALDDAQRAETEAVAAVQTQTDVVARGFLDDDTKRARDRTALEDLRLKATDAQAILAELVRRHAVAVAADEDAQRRVAYDAAKAQATAASADLLKVYPRATRDLVALLGRLAQAQQAVAAANEALPDGAVPIADPEMVARGFAGFPREIVSDEEVEAWGSIERSVPVDDAFQGEIYDCGEGYGKRGHYDGGAMSMGEPARNYRRRIFRKVTYREAVPGVHPYALACAIRLPTVVGDRMLWGAEHLVHDPALNASLMGEGEPSKVLARVAATEGAVTARPPKPERALVVEYLSYREAVPFPEEQVRPDTVSRRADAKPAPVRFGSSPYSLPGRTAGRR